MHCTGELEPGEPNGDSNLMMTTNGPQPRVTLEDLTLWKKFHGLTNEMIVTKSGRLAFTI